MADWINLKFTDVIHTDTVNEQLFSNNDDQSLAVEDDTR